MNSRRFMASLAAAGVCFLLLNLGRSEAQSQNPGNAGGQPSQSCGQIPPGPYQAIERAHCRMKADDENSVRAVLDAVFNIHLLNGQMPQEIETAVKNRLVQAHKAHLNGKAPGVEERSIVTLINSLAAKFGAPAYAKTSLAQVRYLRMSLARDEPQFMGNGMSRTDAKLGDSINTSMSPLQATELIATLIEQKLRNPDYQVPPDEWDPKKTVWPRESEPGRVIFGEVPKATEMQHVISQGLSALSMSDAAQLVDQSFGTLGIK